MPPKRRTSTAASKAQQSTLAFHGSTNRVTKPTTRAHNTKKSILYEAATKSVKKDAINIDAIQEPKPTTVEADIIHQVEKDIATESTPEEEAAKGITDAAITKYWAAKERKRLAPRVHQQELSVHEKVLREFDVSAQYGPCTGIARIKRWKRAYRFDLDPPIEVLAVLMKEQDGNNKLELQRSYLDELLNTRTEVDT